MNPVMLPMLLQGLAVKLLPASLPTSRLLRCRPGARMGGSRRCACGCCLLGLLLLPPLLLVLRPVCRRAAELGLRSSGLTERGGLSRAPARVRKVRPHVMHHTCMDATAIVRHTAIGANTCLPYRVNNHFTRVASCSCTQS